MMGIIDNISLKVIDGNVVNIEYEKSNLSVAIFQMLRLEVLFAQENRYEDIKVERIDGKKLKALNWWSHFRIRFGFHWKKNNYFLN